MVYKAIDNALADNNYLNILVFGSEILNLQF